jgi:riboflavin synthase
MFTGIVQARGEVKSVEHSDNFTRIRITTGMDLADVYEGDSISVNGACLTATVVSPANKEFAADVSPETLHVTTLGSLKVGSGVNLEKALQLSSRLGGHMVAGHVDCVGRLAEKRQVGTGWLLSFQVDSVKYLIDKGSVAVDGVSLTVNRVLGNRFQVMIIPHTSQLTGLTEKNINDTVNVEFDLIGKYVEKFVRAAGGDAGIDEHKLKEYGFM